MAEETFLTNEKDDRLYEVLLNYLELTESGNRPDPERLIADHPEFATELKEYLETHDRVEGLTEPIRWVARAVLEDAAGVDRDCDSIRSEADRVHAARAGARSIGDYEICEEIGRGGMCVVFKARHRTLNRFVALKMVRGSRLTDEDALRRFCNEAETVASLDHPNIVSMYEVDEHDGQLFFSMKLLEGGSLKDRLAEFPTDPMRAARLVAELARAVGYAHRRGVLHRDLKPSNVLLDADGRPHVADFGLAKWLSDENELTQTGALLGTPSYMAPEQASPGPRPRPGTGPGPGRGPNDAVTTAADVYGLGAVLYALLGGQPPFSGLTTLHTLELVRNAPPVSLRSINPRVDHDLETVCLKCLEKDPAHRYRTAEELADDLERWLGNEPVRARRATLGRRLWLLCRRHPGPAVLTGAAAVFLPMLIVTLAVAVVRLGHERDRALAQEIRAEAREKDVLRQLYAADMTLAHRDWLQGDVNSLKHLLDHWRPEPGAEDQRDCAWRLLEPLQSADPLFPPEVTRVHSADIYHLSVSPDGKTVATAGKDGTVRLRKPGREPQVLHGHRGEVNWVKFNRDGTRLATASDDGYARVWNATDGSLLHELTEHAGEVVVAEITPDGKTLITGGGDGKTVLWDLASGSLNKVLDSRGGRVASIAVSPDGRHAATACKDGLVYVWDLVAGSLEYKQPLAGQAQCVAYSPDGRFLAAGDIGGHLWLFAPGDGEPLRMFTCDNGCAVEGVAFSPDSKTLAACGLHGRVRLWDLRRGTLRRNLDCEHLRVWCIAFSPDGQSLYCGAEDGAVRKWDVAAAHAARFLPAAASSTCTSLSFSPDSTTLGVAGSDGTVSFWDPRTCRERTGAKRITASRPGLQLVRFEAHEGVLCVCGPDGTLQRWRVDQPVLLDSLTGPGALPRTLGYRSGVNEWLACLAGPAPVRWDPSTGKSTSVFVRSEPCTAATWSPDGSILAVALADRVRLLRNGTEQLLDLPLSPRRVGSPAVAFSPNGKTLAAVDFGGVIRLWETETWQKGPVLQGRQLSVQTIAFSPSSTILAGGGEDGTVKIWYVASGQELFTLTSRLGGRVFDVAFAPDGSCLAAACDNYDGTKDVTLWPAAAN